MTIMDKINSRVNGVVQSVIDKESLNYLEAGGLYGIIAQGRHLLATLSILYNHAQDRELKKLIKESIEDLTRPTIQRCEELLKEGGAQTPQFYFEERKLHDSIDIPYDARLSDMEIAATIGTIAKTAQTILLAALLQSYQLEIGLTFRKFIDEGLDWNYRLLQLMLKRGWLPHLAKVH